MTLDHVFDQYLRLIWYIVRQHVEESSVRDVVQDICLAVCEQYDKGMLPDNPGAWIRSIVRNKIADFYRNRSSQQRKHDIIAESKPADRLIDDPLSTLSCNEIRSFLQKMQPLDYTIVIQRYVAKASIREIAAEIGTQPDEVSNRLSYLKKLMKKRFH
ncbi:sigma-70 family RNA polymerase sigma factor [bacterium]|nr:sigma-70 family RNA polymerase sigma factor [candidate division CSSED10-310 bacterium]